MNQDQNNENLIEETCDSILDTAKTIYTEECERFKQAETKTSITIAFSGVLLGAYLSFLDKYKLQINDISYLIYSYSFKIAIFLCLITGIVYFLKSIKTDQYDQVSLNEIVTYGFAKELGSVAKMEIAATYKEAIDQNREKIEKKLKFYNFGLNYMTWGLIIFLIHFFIEEVMKYAI